MIRRRDFLKTLSATTLATLGASAPRLLANEAAVEDCADSGSLNHSLDGRGHGTHGDV